MASRNDLIALLGLVAACGGDGSGTGSDGGTGNGSPDSDVPVGCTRCGGLQRGAPWPAEGFDVRNQRRSTFPGPGQPPTILWRAPIFATTDGRAASVAKDGTIYAGGYGGLVTLRPDGSEIARDESPFGGIHTSVADNGLVYVIDDYSDLVETLNPVTQETALLFNYWANGGAVLSPIVGGDDRLYFGGIYGHAMSASGTPAWSILPSGSVQNGARCEYTPAIAPDGTLRFPCNEVLRGVDRDSQILWSAPAATSLEGSAVVDEQGTTYLCASTLVAIDAAGAQRFTSDSCESGTSPALGEDGAIYFARYNELVALNPDGSVRFRFPYYQNDESSPAIDSEGTIYIAADIAADSGAYLIAINTDGTEKWKLPVGTNAGSPSIGLDGRIYVKARDTDGMYKLVAVAAQ